jgi:type IV secretory pathway VirB2 component (pilin)
MWYMLFGAVLGIFACGITMAMSREPGTRKTAALVIALDALFAATVAVAFSIASQNPDVLGWMVEQLKKVLGG